MTISTLNQLREDIQKNLREAMLACDLDTLDNNDKNDIIDTLRDVVKDTINSESKSLWMTGALDDSDEDRFNDDGGHTWRKSL